MGWFSRAPKDGDVAARRLAELQATADSPPEDPVVALQLTRNPQDRSPGAPLTVHNEADPVRVGSPVQLVTLLRTQETRIVEIRVDGRPVEELPSYVTGEIVLDDGVDLSGVYRSSVLQDAGVQGYWGDTGGLFLLEVHTIEPLDRRDVLVSGPSIGEPRVGARASLDPTIGDDDIRWVKIREVRRLADGSPALVVRTGDDSDLQVGDHVTHVA